MAGFFAGMRRTGRGQRFGNDIAESLTIRPALFHSAIESGGVEMHLHVLATLQDEGKSVLEAAQLLLPVLEKGLVHLRQRYGPQQEIAHALRVVTERVGTSGEPAPDAPPDARGLSAADAAAFREAAAKDGYLVKIPFSDRPDILAIPLSGLPDVGMGVLYADFSGLMLAIPTGTDSAKRVKLSTADFVCELSSLVERHGTVLQPQGGYGWAADGSHRRASNAAVSPTEETASSERQSAQPIRAPTPMPAHLARQTSRGTQGPEASSMPDEMHWEAAYEEVEHGPRRVGLWARCLAGSDGDEPAAKASYMRTRVTEMQDQAAHERQATEQVLEQRKVRAQTLPKEFANGRPLSSADVADLVAIARQRPNMVNERDRARGDTLLHHCARHGLHDEVQTLLALGARKDAPNGSGRTALDVAVTDLVRSILSR